MGLLDSLTHNESIKILIDNQNKKSIKMSKNWVINWPKNVGHGNKIDNDAKQYIKRRIKEEFNIDINMYYCIIDSDTKKGNVICITLNTYNHRYYFGKDNFKSNYFIPGMVIPYWHKKEIFPNTEF